MCFFVVQQFGTILFFGDFIGHITLIQRHTAKLFHIQFGQNGLHLHRLFSSDCFNHFPACSLLNRCSQLFFFQMFQFQSIHHLFINGSCRNFQILSVFLMCAAMAAIEKFFLRFLILMPAECVAASADNVFCQRVRFFVAFPNGDFVLPLPHIARESIELFFGYVWFVAVFCNDLAASICRRTCISRISEQATQHIGCPLVGFCIIRLSQNSLFVSHWGFNTLLI